MHDPEKLSGHPEIDVPVVFVTMGAFIYTQRRIYCSSLIMFIVNVKDEYVGVLIAK